MDYILKKEIGKRNNQNMRITIITICYNAEKEIRKTIESVINQTYNDIEYLIIDGASTDGTIEIIQEYLYDSRICFFSEKDHGIYDAMNKGIAKATGDYINFMNAGDCFYNMQVLKDVAKKAEQSHKDIYYGNSIFSMRGNVLYYCSPTDRNGVLRAALRKEMINHQSMFAKSNLLKKRGFNLNYKIVADFDWLVFTLVHGYSFEKIDITVCCFDRTGLSSKAANYLEINREVDNILIDCRALYSESKEELYMENAEYYFDLSRRNYFIMYLLNQWLLLAQQGKSLVDYFQKNNYNKIAVYGMGMLGRRLIDEFKDSHIQVLYGIDKRAAYYTGKFPVYVSPISTEEVDVIVVTACTYFNEIKNDLKTKVKCDIVSLEDILPKVLEEE